MELFYFKNDICSLYISFLLYMVLSYVIILFEFDTMWLPFDPKNTQTHTKKRNITIVRLPTMEIHPKTRDSARPLQPRYLDHGIRGKVLSTGTWSHIDPGHHGVSQVELFWMI